MPVFVLGKGWNFSDKKYCISQSVYEALIEPVKLSDSGFGMFLTFPF